VSIRTLTQEDPIGLAGGLNLYGFAGGDPINFWDPFGLSADTLVIMGDELANDIREQRAANPQMDAQLSELEESELVFTIFDSSVEGVCIQDLPPECPGTGFAWGGDEEVPWGLATQFQNTDHLAHVNVAMARGLGYNAGHVAWHELVHLLGFAHGKGRKYRHDDPAFVGVPRAGGSR